MRLTEALGISPGVIACIGGGGKTSLVLRLAEECKEKGRVVVCSTAKMHVPENMPELLPDAGGIEAAFKAHNPVAVGIRTPEGKFTLDVCQIGLMRALADYVLIEADGSKGLSLKAHAPHEPVIPAKTDKVVLVIGIDGLGKPILQAAHRPELYAALLEDSLAHIVTPRDAARVIRAEALHDIVFINKVETEAQLALARELAKELDCPVVAGALQKKEEVCLLS